MLSSFYKKIFGKTDSTTTEQKMDDESESKLAENLGEMDLNESGDSDESKKHEKIEHEETDKTELKNAEATNDSNQEEFDKTKIVKEDVILPTCFKDKGYLAFVLHNVFSKEECKDYIKKTTKMGYAEALVNVGGGRQRLMKDVRNNTRCIWDSVDEGNRIWQRIKSYIPATWANRDVMGLNERLRFLKYEPGEYFAPHMDGCYMRDNGERSYITIQLYLNEGFEGGSTTFMNFAEKERHEVVPKTGMVLVFQHDIMHEGSKLIKGRKYSMRTDVMYSSKVNKKSASTQ